MKTRAIRAKQPSRRALHRISNFTSAPPPFAAIPARPFLAPFAADPPDLRPTTPRSESLARNRATLRYVRELRPARLVVRLLNGHDTSGFWRESILKVRRDDTVHDVGVDVTGALVTLLDRIDEGVEELLLLLVGEIGVGVDLGFKF